MLIISKDRDLKNGGFWGVIGSAVFVRINGVVFWIVVFGFFQDD